MLCSDFDLEDVYTSSGTYKAQKDQILLDLSNKQL